MAILSLINDLKLTTVLGKGVVESGGINCQYKNVGSENQYITQRPAVTGTIENPNKVPGQVSRGSIKNSLGNGEFIIYGTSIFTSSYAMTLINTLSISKLKVYSCELNDFTFFNDVAGNKAYIADGLPQTINENTELNDIITNTGGFLAKGCAALNGSIYVQLKSGEIYNSAVEDASKWNSLSFISSERQPDEAIYLDVLGNNIVSINLSTIEFFYDAGTGTGSRLLPRTDISLDIGGLDSDCYVKNNNSIYFIGRSDVTRSSVSIFELSNFSVKKISTLSIDSFLYNSTRPRLWGYSAGGIFFLNVLRAEEDSFDPFTLTYDTLNGIWTQSIYPVIMLNSDKGNILSYDGDLYQGKTAAIQNLGVDTVNTGGFTTTQQIKSTVILQNSNFNTNKFKRIKKLSINSEPSRSDFYIDIEGTNFGLSKFKRKFNINANKDTKQAQRLGRFKTMGFKIDFGGILSNDLAEGEETLVELSSLEVDI